MWRSTVALLTDKQRATSAAVKNLLSVVSFMSVGLLAVIVRSSQNPEQGAVRVTFSPGFCPGGASETVVSFPDCGGDLPFNGTTPYNGAGKGGRALRVRSLVNPWQGSADGDGMARSVLGIR